MPSQINSVSLDGVAASASVSDSGGRLLPIGGIIPKLLAALNNPITPDHTVIVAHDQDLAGSDLRPDPLNDRFYRHRDKDFTVIRARDVDEAVKLLDADQQ